MSAELSPEQLTELEADLHALASELGAMLEISSEAAKPVDLDQPIGRVSRMDAIQQQKMIASNRASQKARLGLVGVALAALEAGDYGECRACEEPIGFRRLKARPESRLCVSCQSSRERR